MINKLKFLFISIFSNLLLVNLAFWATREARNKEIRDGMLFLSNDTIVESTDKDGFNVLSEIFIWAKDSMTGIIVLIAIWVFLFIWARVAMSRWNPEEFKKGVMQLIYAAVWIFVVSAAWALVTLVAWIKI